MPRKPILFFAESEVQIDGIITKVNTYKYFGKKKIHKSVKDLSQFH